MLRYKVQALFSTCLIVCSLWGISQSSITIKLNFNNSADEILTLNRKNIISNKQEIDTFERLPSGKFLLEINNNKTPSIALIRSATQKFREVFVAPGYQLIINVNKINGRDHFDITGSGAELDSVFLVIWNEKYTRFASAFEVSSPSNRLKLFDRVLEDVDQVVQRPVKDYMFFLLMQHAIDSAETILALNDHYAIFHTYLKQIANAALKKNIDLNYSNRLDQLIAEQTGKQAPFFSLSDSTGRAYRVTDYRGKLVYIDLWASWCLPCRLESRYLQKLVSKYNKRDIIFIGIAVGDNTINWKKALKQDRPHWLQLFDRNAVVANAYAVKSVPRYVLISRAGNVVDFNAPPPSQPAKLIALIEKELKTQDN